MSRSHHIGAAPAAASRQHIGLLHHPTPRYIAGVEGLEFRHQLPPNRGMNSVGSNEQVSGCARAVSEDGSDLLRVLFQSLEDHAGVAAFRRQSMLERAIDAVPSGPYFPQGNFAKVCRYGPGRCARKLRPRSSRQAVSRCDASPRTVRAGCRGRRHDRTSRDRCARIRQHPNRWCAADWLRTIRRAIRRSPGRGVDSRSAPTQSALIPAERMIARQRSASCFKTTAVRPASFRLG
jgi:hypothetical protein